MPDWAAEIRRRISLLKLAPVREAEIVEELAQHVEDRYQELLAQGVAEAEAARVVFAELIDNDRFTRELRRVEPPVAQEPKSLFLHSLIQDIRYGIRTLKKQPAFTCVVVLTLALGIGVNTAIFSVVNAVLLRPLPFPHSDQLVTVTMANPRLGGDNLPLSVADFLDWRAQNQAFQDLAAYTDNWFSLTGSGEPQRLKGVWVTAGFFSTLGATPLFGRTFSAGEDAANGEPLVILSQRTWQQSFASDPQIVGKAITLNGHSRMVVGVMPHSFNFPAVDEHSLPGDVDLWILHTLIPTTRRGPYYLRGIARLKPDTSLQQAQSELNNIGLRIRQDNPLTNAETTFVSRSLKAAIIGDVGRMLFVLFGGVAFVLLIASLNVANLSLSRAASRSSEIAIRTALGAGRRRIMRQLLTESLLLASVGAAGGVLLAWWGLHLLRTIGSNPLPRLQEVSIDARVLAFTAFLSLLSGLLFGFVPAWQASRTGLSQYLRNTQAATGSPAWRRTRKLLVVAEVALSIVLLAGAGLMLNSFLRLKRVSPGFAPERILTTEISLPLARYKEPAQLNTFYEQLMAQVRNLPGVEAAGIGMSLPPNLLSISDTFTIEGAPPGKSDPSSPDVIVSSGYFEALGIPLLAGRNFTEMDRADKPRVVIINQTFAHRYFPHESPIGKRMKTGGSERPNNPWMEIVGVVSDVKYEGLDVAPEPTYYEHYQQASWSETYLVVRSSSEPRALASGVRQAVWSLDKDLPVANVQTMEELLSESVARPRFRTFVFLVLGTLAIVLAVTGIYGVISYFVSQRTREIGIRVALGAQRRTVLHLVIRQGMTLALVGALLGLIAAFVLTRLLTGLLYEVEATDPLTFVSITILLLLVSLAACWIPARRAAKVDPLVALRDH
ncbi:MAG TPA: ABC transporter permease [Pyrinomonadaceae bacterium]|nr:ABC transporter permease [Pyrinomonadaceae bacterium]